MGRRVRSRKQHEWPFLIRTVGQLGLAACWIVGLALVAWNVMRFYPGDSWFPVRLGNYFAPWLLMVAALATLVAALGRRRWLTGLVGLSTLLLLGRFWPLLTPRLNSDLAYATINSAPRLRVMTFNVHYSNRNTAGIAQLIQDQAPDVVAFQEFTRELGDPLHSQLATAYPYYLPDDARQPRLALISRYPLTALPPGPWRTQCARLDLPAASVVVWNVHAMPAISRSGWEWQRRGLEALGREVAAEPGPIVVLGDFNTTDQNENYRLVAEHLLDVHRAIGWGFGFTFPDTRLYLPALPRLGPVLRIDHIFVSQHWAPQDIQIIPNGHGSDHLPVIATLRLIHHP